MSCGGLQLILFVYVFLTFEEAHSVSIKSISVPSVHIIRRFNPHQPVVLDCDYTDADDYGLVLKWALNDRPIYRWIIESGRAPIAIEPYRNFIDATYETSSEPRFKHKALYIKHPDVTMIGNYTCAVMSFLSEDSKTAPMNMVVEEERFDITYSLNSENIIVVNCSVEHIFPEPKLQMSYGVDNRKIVTINSVEALSGNLFNANAVGFITEDMTNVEAIKCILAIPETGYYKEKDVVPVSDIQVKINVI